MAATDLPSELPIRAGLKRAVAEGQAKRIADGGGLYLDTRPTGAGWWRLHDTFNGREGMANPQP